MQRIANAINGKAIQENRPLELFELQTYVPSIFARTGHESRSERFQPISTHDVLQELTKHNWHPFFAVQNNVRDQSKREFTRHMLRLRQPDQIMSPNGTVNEIILTNANDGTSAFNLLSGKFRFICQNGLICPSAGYGHNKVYHKGNNIMDDVIEGVYTVVDDFAESDRYQNEMNKIVLDEKSRKAMAVSAYVIKEGMPEDMDFRNLKYQPDALLKPHNTEDRHSKTLLSTFNVLQENMMKGGQSGFTESGRRRTTRRVTNIDKTVELNTLLWQFAKQMVDSGNI